MEAQKIRKTNIYWFSGTGNSLFAAKTLEKQIDGAALVPMASGIPKEVVGGIGEAVGFVFPSYYCNLPFIVRDFIEKTEFDKNSYFFSVVTMGGFGQGTLWALENALKRKGLKLSYGRCVRMPGNYIVSYNPKNFIKLSPIDKYTNQILKFADEINKRSRKVRKLKFSAQKLYNAANKLDKAFVSSDRCNSCKTCEKICPVGNITIENGKPKWNGRCMHCMACISYCPQKAIEYGKNTKGRMRYHNPYIKPKELFKPGEA